MTITTLESTAPLTLPITLFFWGFVAAYAVHIIEESVMGETFVGMMQRLEGPGYQWKHFFWFNTLLMSLIIMATVIYEIFGGHLIVLPLIFVFQMATNGLWHLLATVIRKKYSPGLVTSLIYWILFYFILRYSIFTHQIGSTDTIMAAIIGTLLTVAMIGSIFIARKKFRKVV